MFIKEIVFFNLNLHATLIWITVNRNIRRLYRYIQDTIVESAYYLFVRDKVQVCFDKIEFGCQKGG